MEDRNYDYLLPTCMLKRGTKQDPVTMDTVSSSFYVDSIFDETFKALEDETCSEISDRSYAEASYYTRMKMWNSPYLERQWYSDTEDNTDIKQPSTNTSSQFDLSLQQFLEWPDSSGGQDSDPDIVLTETYHTSNDVTKTRRKTAEKRKRATRGHSALRGFSSHKRAVLPRVVVESDSDCSPHSEEEEEVFTDYTCLTGHKLPPSTVTVIHGINKVYNKDSDSDYRTYSDTSSDRLDTNTTTRPCDPHNTTRPCDPHNTEVDLTPLKSLMSNVLLKSENISNKLQGDILHGDDQSTHVAPRQDGVISKINSTCNSRTGGELEQFKHLLEKADDTLTQSELTVETLLLKLEDAKEKTEAENVTKQLQEKVDDLQRKLDEKTQQCEEKCIHLETVARQLDVLNTSCEDSNVVDEILAEIKLLQSINAAVNPLELAARKSSDKHTGLTVRAPQPDVKDRTCGVQCDLPTSEHIELCDSKCEADMTRQTADLTQQITDLKKTLSATEETVHCQTHKMKHYRSMLGKHGLLPDESRSRSNSFPSSTVYIQRSQSCGAGRRHSVDNHTQRHRSVSPTRLNRPGTSLSESAEDIEKLYKENSKLKEQVNGYRRVLRVFQGKTRQCTGLDVAGVQEDDLLPLSAESSHCYLECWLGIVEKFLSDLSQSDQDGNLYHSPTAFDVTRIKIGITEARESLQTLADLCTSQHNSSLDVSSDSGCSHVSTSSQRMTGDKCTLRRDDGSSHLVSNSDRSRIYNKLNTAYKNVTSSKSKHGDKSNSWLKLKLNRSDNVCNTDRATSSNKQCKDVVPSHTSHTDNVTDTIKSRRCGTKLPPSNQHSTSHIGTVQQQHIEHLDQCVSSYVKHLQSDMQCIQEQFQQLVQLRDLMEKHHRYNELPVLVNVLNTCEKMVQSSKTKLDQCKHLLQQKISISDKRNNSSKTSAELELCYETVASLEKELSAEKASVVELTGQCKRTSAVPGCGLDKTVEMDIPDLKNRLNELEMVALQWSQNEVKYKTEVKRLTTDLEQARADLIESRTDTDNVKHELEKCRDVIEQQTLHLCDKTQVIDNLRDLIQKQDNSLQQQDVLCRELTSKLECVNTSNDKLCIQTELDKHRCEDYKQQTDKLNQQLQHCNDRLAKLKAELALSVQMRNSVDKLMAKEKKDKFEATKLKDKYLYNLKITYRELAKMKKDYREDHRKLEEISSLNRTLQTELKVRSTLMDKKGDMLTDDEKQNMITDLLHEVHQLRQQLSDILQQYHNMNATLAPNRKYKSQTQSRRLQNGSSNNNTSIDKPTHKLTTDQKSVSCEMTRQSVMDVPIIHVSMVP